MIVMIKKNVPYLARVLPPSTRDVTVLRLPPSHQFGPDGDYEEEEEIICITLELGKVEPSLIPSCDSYHLVGLDTPTAFLQLAGTMLEGRHEVLLGTELLFSGRRNIIHRKHTTAYLFQRSSLEEKGKAKAKADACQLVLDRITGKLAPLRRRHRTQKIEVAPKDY
ncbi:hypothetical protein EDD18DRAFT_570376 [Armillaria luteobubalina]|uniref:Transcription factor TFIIIC triple barrel domain-containing protein n=1 Tax=Armillaria luteobubalina TaxID=153913 RepID=A0AA39PU33_9AGAR|nr:hypothetical protein EDD18DRAFT_570376 [Armillaria luteobubalina]